MNTRIYHLPVLFLLLLFCSGSLLAQSSTETLRELEEQHRSIHKDVRSSTVMVQCEVPSGPREGPYYGTGVLISSEGHILSCTSVIPANAGNIEITLPSGKSKKAEMLGASLQYEITIIKIPGKNYTHLERGDSSSLGVGDRVYTAGNAFSLGGRQLKISFSSGIVSGLYETESVYWQSQYRGISLESDSAINPGTDGGPMVNENGELIGIITLSADRARWLGMGTPTHLFRSYLNTILARDRGKRNDRNKDPYLGLELKETEDNTLAVSKVSPNSPTWEAGLQKGDVIMKADGNELSSLEDFDDVMKEKAPGDQIMIYLERGKQKWATIIEVGIEPM